MKLMSVGEALNYLFDFCPVYVVNVQVAKS